MQHGASGTESQPGNHAAKQQANDPDDARSHSEGNYSEWI
jgi:hypothetical protein